MGGVQKFNEGAQILQQVDVTSIITSLALGIAEAQEKLDDNSIRQISRLTELEIAGKSLLELGFQPAFYAFEYADVSASLNLKMALSNSIDIALSIAGEYKKNSNFDKDYFKRLEEIKKESKSSEAKSRKIMALKSSEKKSIEIHNKTFEIHKEEGSLSKILKAEEHLRDETQNIRAESVVDNQTVVENQSQTEVKIEKENGLITVAIPTTHANAIALLKLDNSYTLKTTIKLNAKSTPDTFKKETDFSTTLTNAKTKNGGTVIGFNNSKIYRDNKQIDLQFYFGWDKKTIEFDYSFNKNNPSLNMDDFKLLAMLLKNSTDTKITITGYTDGSGANDYNSKLGKERANAVKNLLKKYGNFGSDDQFTILSKGESEASDESKDPNLRKIKIEIKSTNSFIYFDGGEITTGANGNTKNPFVFKENDTTSSNINDVKFKYGNKVITIIDTSSNKFGTNQKGKFDEFYFEKVNDIYYLLHEDSKITYLVSSKEEKEINIKIDGKSEEEIDKEQTEVYLSKTENDQSRLDQATKKFGGDNSFAMSGSIDARYSRQFGMSVEGNAAISARMISLPPPDGLKMYLETLYTKSDS